MGGSADWLGNWASQDVQWLRVIAMSVAMFGQNKDFSALNLIDVVPWWAEWRVDNTRSLRVSGTTALSPMYTIPPCSVSRSLTLQ